MGRGGVLGRDIADVRREDDGDRARKHGLGGLVPPFRFAAYGRI